MVMRALTTRWPGASDCERLTSKGPSARGVCNLLHNSTTYSGVGLAVRPSGRPGPDRHAEDNRSLPIRSGFEADQEDHLALLLGNSREGAIEIARREPPCRIGCCYRGWPMIVNLARGAFSHIAPDTVYVQVMHKREEAGAEIGTALHAALQSHGRGCPGPDRRPGTRRGSRHEHSAAAAEFLFREVDQNRSSYPPIFSASCRPGMARESEGRRRHLDYGEAQSFQDLPLCRFPRLIGDELDAGLARSSGISVEDFQTHPHAPWVLAPSEHAGKIRSRIASETTYGRSAEATASRTWAPAETPEASSGSSTILPMAMWWKRKRCIATIWA